MGGDIVLHHGAEPIAEAAVNGSGGVRQRNLSEHKQLAEAYASLLLFMVVYCARPEDWIPGLSNAPLAKIAGGLALIAFVLSLGQIRRRMPREVILVVLLVLQLFATVPLSPVWKGGALNQTVDFAKVAIVVLVMVIAVNTAARLRQVLLVQAVSVAAISATTVWKGHMWGSRLAGVLNGNYSNPNDLAISIVLTLPLCLALLLLSKNPLAKAVWTLAIIIMAYAVLMTGSRAGFVSLAITGAVCLWEFAIRGRRRYLLALAAIAGVALSLASGSILGERLRGTFNSDEDVESAYGSAQARQQLLWRSLEVTAEHPLFGVGPGNFQEVSGVWHETHNSYTQVSAEGGIPALVLYVSILGYGFKNIRTANKLPSGNATLTLLAGALRASLTGFVVGSFFGSYAYQFFPYFLVAYTTALLQISKGRATRSESDQSADNASRVAMDLPLAEYRNGSFSRKLFHNHS